MWHLTQPITQPRLCAWLPHCAGTASSSTGCSSVALYTRCASAIASLASAAGAQQHADQRKQQLGCGGTPCFSHGSRMLGCRAVQLSGCTPCRACQAACDPNPMPLRAHSTAQHASHPDGKQASTHQSRRRTGSSPRCGWRGFPVGGWVNTPAGWQPTARPQAHGTCPMQQRPAPHTAIQQRHPSAPAARAPGTGSRCRAASQSRSRAHAPPSPP